jgi:hypothetical protein
MASFTLSKGPDIMSRYVRLRGMVLILIIGTFPIRGDARGRNGTTHDGAVDFGAQLLHLDDGCLSLDGTVTSGTFFEHLKRTEINSRFEFKKRGRVVADYPESLTTSIRIAGSQCATLSNRPSAVFRGDSYSLKFQVEWKEGMQLRPAALSPVGARCVGFSSVVIPSQETIPSITCQLTVDSKGVPLDDHLIVSIFAPDGTRLTRLSAGP